MSQAKQVAKLGQLCLRRMSSSVNEVPSPRFNKLKAKQEKFGSDDGVPVFLKGGFGDKVLYQTTFALTLLGVGMGLEVFYNLAVGKK